MYKWERLEVINRCDS